MRRLLQRLLGVRLPEGFPGTLDAEEHVVAVAEGEPRTLVATSLGLWIAEAATARRIGWHLVSKAVWQDGVLSVVEAEIAGRAGDAVLISDRPTVHFPLRAPGNLPNVVRQRVDSSIRSRYYKDLGSGGAWFVQRKIPGARQDVLQVRPDPGTDIKIVSAIAEEAAAKLRR